MKQPMSGTRMGHATEVVVDTKIIPSKQYPMSLPDQSQSYPEGASEPLPTKAEYNMVAGIGIGGDLGVRESPSGASSPSGTPNNTLVKSSKMSYHYDPLTASASANKLDLVVGAGGLSNNLHKPPQDGMETVSDTNLLNYPLQSGGMVSGRIKQAKGPVYNSPAPHKVQGTAVAAGVKSSVKEWESKTMKMSGEHVEGAGVLVGRVLHPPVSTSAKERGRGGGEQLSSLVNGYGGDNRGKQ